MRHVLITVAALLGSFSALGQESERLYLSGTDKDHTRTWEFFCTGGMNSGRWTTIEVPSCWELQGFGTYNYGHDRPHADEQGRYRYTFKVPSSMKGRTVPFSTAYQPSAPSSHVPTRADRRAARPTTTMPPFAAPSTSEENRITLNSITHL